MSQTTELTTEALLIMILDKKLQENLRPFHRAMDDLKQSVNFMSDKFDSLTNKYVSEVEEKCEDALKENKFLKAEVLRLSKLLNKIVKLCAILNNTVDVST